MKKNKLGIILVMALILASGCSNKGITASSANQTEAAQTQTEYNTVNELNKTKEALPTSTSSSELLLYPAYETVNGETKYGYINSSGTFVIEPIYSSASDFNDGIAIVTASDTYKIIDTNGKVLYTTKDSLQSYENGYAIFSQSVDDNYLYGYIDKTGKIAIKASYLSAEPFKEDGTAIVSTETGTYARINQEGEVLESFKLDSKYTNSYGSEDGYIIYSSDDYSKQGVVTYKGDAIFEIEGQITYLGDGLFAVKKASDTFEYMTQPAAIFNSKGEQLTDYTLYDISEFTDGYASVTDDKYTYFIGEDGQIDGTLPKAEGRGTLTLTDNLIKAEVDGDLIYMTKDGTVIWQNDRTENLSDGITVNAVKFKPNKYAVVFYPVIEGLTEETVQTAINDKLYQIFAESRASLTKEDATSVEDSFTAELNKDLLIINKTGYDYPFGAAHGMPINSYYFINIKTGDFYELKDLFIKDSDYVSKINDIINNMIDSGEYNEEYMLFDDGFQGIADDQYFKLTKESLIIYFYPYDIAPYAAGFPEFEISFDKLDSILNKDGAFWNSFQE